MFQSILRYRASQYGTTDLAKTLSVATCDSLITSVDIGKLHQKSGSKNASVLPTYNIDIRHKTTSRALKVESQKNWGSDPVANQYKYWNPHTSKDRGERSYLLDMSPESIKVEAKIISLSTADDPANAILHSSQILPTGSTLLSVGTTLQDVQSTLRRDSS